MSGSLLVQKGWKGSGSSSRASLGRHGRAGKQGSCLLAALGRHVLQALRVEPIEVQPERQKPQKLQLSAAPENLVLMGMEGIQKHRARRGTAGWWSMRSSP